MRIQLISIVAAAMCAACGGSVAAPATTVPATTVPSTAAAPATSTSAATAAAAPSPPAAAPSPGRLPDAFEPAGNGALLSSTSDGDIVEVDLDRGRTQTIIGGPEVDEAPYLSPNGMFLLFDRKTGTGAADLWVADHDGSDARPLIPGSLRIGWVEWSPQSDRVAVVPVDGGDAWIYDIATGEPTRLHTDEPIVKLGWLPNDRLILVTRHRAGGTGFATASEDGTDFTQLSALADATDEWSISQDGTRIAYMSWGSAPGSQGRIHVLDIATGKDTLLTPWGDGFEWEEPVFSPDGRWVKVDRHDASEAPLQLALLPADGSGEAVLLGPAQSEYEGGTSATFAPDGTQLLVMYLGAGETYLFDVATGAGSKVDWPDLQPFATWQRLAPQ